MFTKILIKNSLIKIINHLILFGIIIYLNRYYDNEVIALYFYYLNLISFLSLLINYGYSYNSQEQIPKFNNNNELIDNFISIHLTTLFLNFFIISILIFLILNPNINSFFICLVVLFYSINLFFSESLRALKNLYFAHFILFNVLVMFNLILILLYFKFFIFFESTFLLIFLFSNLNVFIIYLIFINKKKIFKINFFKFRFSEVYKYYKKYIFNFFNTLSFVLISYFLTMMLFHYSSSIDVIKYNISYLLGTVFSLPLVFLNNVYARKFSLYSKNDNNSYSSKISQKISKVSVILSIILLIPVFIILYFYSENIFSINFNEYMYSFLIFWLAFLINNSFGPNETFLFANSKGNKVFISNILSIILIIIFLYVFIDKIDYLYCSFAFLLYQLLKNIFLNIFIKRIFNTNVSIFNL